MASPPNVWTLVKPMAEEFAENLKKLQGGMLGVSNTLSGGFTDMAAKVTDLIVPGLGTLGQTLLEFPQKLLAAVTPFVEALNPALLLTFNQQLANLQATVGTAFENVFNILAPVLDQVAGLIQSSMDALRPVVDTFTEMMGSYFVAAVQAAVTEFKALMPIIEVLMQLFGVTIGLMQLLAAIVRPIVELLGFVLKVVLAPLTFLLSVINKYLEGLNAVMNVLDTVFSTVIETVQELITTFMEGLGLSSVFDMIEDAFKNLISIILQLIAFAAKFLGQDAFLDKLIKNLDKQAHAIAAPKDVSFKGIEAITKDIATAAFTAGFGTEKTQTDYIKDGLEEMKKIRNGEKTLETFLEQQFNKLLDALNPAKKVQEKADKFTDDHPWLSNLTTGGLAGALRNLGF